jgi:hypothetical protein
LCSCYVLICIWALLSGNEHALSHRHQREPGSHTTAVTSYYVCRTTASSGIVGWTTVIRSHRATRLSHGNPAPADCCDASGHLSSARHVYSFSGRCIQALCAVNDTILSRNVQRKPGSHTAALTSYVCASQQHLTPAKLFTLLRLTSLKLPLLRNPPVHVCSQVPPLLLLYGCCTSCACSPRCSLHQQSYSGCWEVILGRLAQSWLRQRRCCCRRSGCR